MVFKRRQVQVVSDIIQPVAREVQMPLGEFQGAEKLVLRQDYSSRFRSGPHNARIEPGVVRHEVTAGSKSEYAGERLLPVTCSRDILCTDAVNADIPWLKVIDSVRWLNQPGCPVDDFAINNPCQTNGAH
ncbi:hypothetical protein PJ267_16915 [Arthrobacter sp. OVS8]|nr:hypothetical protein PJ267_16915 [Arthrobacter sp. OVS8]